MGIQLARLGIDLNLAPVVDVVPDARPGAIGARSYGRDPERVARLASALVRGMRRTETRCCAKHWPGYGPVRPDPHHHVVRTSIAPSLWLKTHMPPFRAVVGAGADAVMTAHVVYDFLGARPATVNPRAYARLRDPRLAGIAFDGPVLTDDLEMAAVARFYPNAIGRLARDAVGAGADMVLVCGRPASAVAAYRDLQSHSAKHLPDYRVHAARIATLRGRRLPEPGTSTSPGEAEPPSSPDR